MHTVRTIDKTIQSLQTRQTQTKHADLIKRNLHTPIMETFTFQHVHSLPHLPSHPWIVIHRSREDADRSFCTLNFWWVFKETEPWCLWAGTEVRWNYPQKMINLRDSPVCCDAACSSSFIRHHQHLKSECQCHRRATRVCIQHSLLSAFLFVLKSQPKSKHVESHLYTQAHGISFVHTDTRNHEISLDEKLERIQDTNESYRHD